MCVCVCVCVCVSAYMCVCVCSRALVCVRERERVHVGVLLLSMIVGDCCCTAIISKKNRWYETFTPPVTAGVPAQPNQRHTDIL